MSSRRLRAVAILRFGTIDALHKRLPLCSRAIDAQFHRGRLSTLLVDGLTSTIGAEAFAFVTGQTDTLRDIVPDVPLVKSSQIAIGSER